MSDFEKRNAEFISRMGQDESLGAASRDWLLKATPHEYSYHFTWLGRPVIQYPQDLVAMQELIWTVQPERIVETGVARGGSLIFYASMLELLGGDGRVIGIDVDLRPDNRAAIHGHRFGRRVDIVDGSSIDPEVSSRIGAMTAGRRVLVALDSNHTHDHVLEELRLYSPLVQRGSYLVVFDTMVEQMPDEHFTHRPWRRGNSPGSAVQAFLEESNRFEVDREMDHKLQISACPGGYLRCVRD